MLNVLIYTRPSNHESSINPDRWHAALARHGLSDIAHSLSVCHGQEELRESLPGTHIVVSSKADLCRLIHPDHTDLKMIFFAFAGVDHLAPFDWVPNDAYLVNNSGASAQAIGEYVIFAMLLLTNRLIRRDQAAFAETASQLGFACLAGANVTIIGAGGVGRGVAAKCKAFRMNVRGVRRSGAPEKNFDIMHSPSELEAAVSESDFVVVACPVTFKTRDLVSKTVIGKMKPGSFLINVARGAIVDEEALCDAVERGTIGGAVLDVVRASSSDAAARVRNTPGVLVTPHVSGDDPCHYIDRSLDVLMDNLHQFLRGERPKNAIDFEQGY